MKKSLFIISCTLLIALQACQFDFRQHLAGADTIMLVFYPTNENSLNDTVRITEKDLILEFTRNATQKIDKDKTCKPEGKIIFLKQRVKETLLETDFSINHCQFLTFQYQNQQFIHKIDKASLEIIEYARKHRDLLREDL